MFGSFRKKNYLCNTKKKRIMKRIKKLNLSGTTITDEDIKRAEQVLIDNGIEADEADIVLQAVGYAMLNLELYDED